MVRSPIAQCRCGERLELKCALLRLAVSYFDAPPVQGSPRRPKGCFDLRLVKRLSPSHDRTAPKFAIDVVVGTEDGHAARTHTFAAMQSYAVLRSPTSDIPTGSEEEDRDAWVQLWRNERRAQDDWTPQGFRPNTWKACMQHWEDMDWSERKRSFLKLVMAAELRRQEEAEAPTPRAEGAEPVQRRHAE